MLHHSSRRKWLRYLVIYFQMADGSCTGSLCVLSKGYFNACGCAAKGIFLNIFVIHQARGLLILIFPWLLKQLPFSGVCSIQSAWKNKWNRATWKINAVIEPSLKFRLVIFSERVHLKKPCVAFPRIIIHVKNWVVSLGKWWRLLAFFIFILIFYSLVVYSSDSLHDHWWLIFSLNRLLPRLLTKLLPGKSR